MDTKTFFAATRLSFAVAVADIVLFTVKNLLVALVHPAMAPVWMLLVLTLLFLFVIGATNTGSKAEKIGKLFSRWIWEGKLGN